MIDERLTSLRDRADAKGKPHVLLYKGKWNAILTVATAGIGRNRETVNALVERNVREGRTPPLAVY